MARPLQVYLEDTEMKQLDEWAQARGWTKSQAIRAAIRALTRAPADDSILDLIGIFDGLPPDLSANFDRYVNETFVAERAAPYRARPRRSPRPRR